MAAGRRATASDSHSQKNCFETVFLLSSFDETTTELHLHAEKHTEIALHLNLGQFVVFFWFCVVLVWFGFFCPLMRQ
jgi:hypothetical protein